jgi:hypothetical protein
MILDKNAFLESMKLKQETVTIEGGEVVLSELGATDMMNLYTRKELQNENGDIVMSKFIPALVAVSAIDEDGKRLFSDEDIPLLEKAASSQFGKLAQVARRLNGLVGDESKK